MDIMEPTYTTKTPGDRPDDVWIVVESDDREELVFHAGSQDELDAKLDDFRTWAD